MSDPQKPRDLARLVTEGRGVLPERNARLRNAPTTGPQPPEEDSGGGSGGAGGGLLALTKPFTIGTGTTELTFSGATVFENTTSKVTFDGSNRLLFQPGVFGFAGMLFYGSSGGTYRGVEMNDNSYLIRYSMKTGFTGADSRVAIGGVYTVEVPQNIYIVAMKDIGSSSVTIELMVSQIF